MNEIRAVVSDFGGVLTSPLADAFLEAQVTLGVPIDVFGEALYAIERGSGGNPLHELERGSIPEAEVIEALEREVAGALGRQIDLSGLGQAFFGRLLPNREMIELLQTLAGRNYRIALLTNNVREWQPLWRALIPVEELFEQVVDSAFVGMRKPERGIYELLLRLLDLDARQCLFVDDREINCEAARELGFHTVHFRSTSEAITAIEAALSRSA